MTDHLVRQLGPEDLDDFAKLLTLFAEAFNDPESYADRRPRPEYLRRLLGKDNFIALAAVDGDALVGALAAYVLEKFEQERSEIYIYDLAVDAAHRREGIATAMLNEIKAIAARRGAWVIFVQADYGDDPAIALYTRLGSREDVLHFDIAVS